MLKVILLKAVILLRLSHFLCLCYCLKHSHRSSSFSFYFCFFFFFFFFFFLCPLFFFFFFFFLPLFPVFFFYLFFSISFFFFFFFFFFTARVLSLLFVCSDHCACCPVCRSSVSPFCLRPCLCPPDHHFVSFTHYRCSPYTYRCARTFAFSFVCLYGFVLSKGCLSLQMEAWVWQRSETETEMLTDGLSGCVRALLPEPTRQEQTRRIVWVGGGGSDCELVPFLILIQFGKKCGGKWEYFVLFHESLPFAA